MSSLNILDNEPADRSEIFVLSADFKLLRRNTIANFFGQTIPAIIGFLLVPVYINLLGIESYALVALSASFQAVLKLTDLGLSSTLSREFARYSSDPSKAYEMRDLLKTMQTIYWGISLVVACIVLILAPFLSQNWLNPDRLSVGTVQTALLLMGMSVVLQGPMSLYSGGILGLQRHVLANSINLSIGMIRTIGVILVLYYLSPTIIAFLSYQLLVVTIGTILLGITLWKILPKSEKPAQIHFSYIKNVWKFAAGMSLTSVFWLILSQLDKAILSKMLSLQFFGYYALASVVAGGLNYFSAPIFTTVLPRYTQMFAKDDSDGLRFLYHGSSQVMTVIIVPIATILALFSREILNIWTGDPIVSQNASILVSLLVMGTALNGLASLPYALQVSSGLSELGAITNLIAVIVFTPLMVMMVYLFEAAGAAMVWILLNLGYVVIYVHFLHKRVLRGEALHWYLGIAAPVAVIVFVGVLARSAIGDINGYALIVYLSILWFVMVLSASMASSKIRYALILWATNRIRR